MTIEYLKTVSQLRHLYLNTHVPAEELDFDCQRLVKAYSSTDVELNLNLQSDNVDKDWGDLRTVCSDSDDSSGDSDEVFLGSRQELLICGCSTISSSSLIVYSPRLGLVRGPNRQHFRSPRIITS